MTAIGDNARKGTRELKKEDKLRRIRDAARSLFIANGYDDTSTREIAVRAGVALGTLFLYAANKRDLLFLVVNDELEDVTLRAAAAVKAEAPFLGNLLSAFRQLYDFFGREPRLARLALREMTFYDAGHQAKRFIKTRERMISLCSEVVRMAQEKGELAAKGDAQKIGAVIFAVFQIEVRRWLAPRRVEVEEGLSRLRESLEIVMAGLSPSSRAFEMQ
jgi:AcrR family transcriptional regulator